MRGAYRHCRPLGIPSLLATSTVPPQFHGRIFKYIGSILHIGQSEEKFGVLLYCLESLRVRPHDPGCTAGSDSALHKYIYDNLL